MDAIPSGLRERSPSPMSRRARPPKEPLEPTELAVSAVFLVCMLIGFYYFYLWVRSNVVKRGELALKRMKAVRTNGMHVAALSDEDEVDLLPTVTTWAKLARGSHLAAGGASALDLDHWVAGESASEDEWVATACFSARVHIQLAKEGGMILSVRRNSMWEYSPFHMPPVLAYAVICPPGARGPNASRHAWDDGRALEKAFEAAKPPETPLGMPRRLRSVLNLVQAERTEHIGKRPHYFVSMLKAAPSDEGTAAVAKLLGVIGELAELDHVACLAHTASASAERFEAHGFVAQEASELEHNPTPTRSWAIDAVALVRPVPISPAA